MGHALLKFLHCFSLTSQLVFIHVDGSHVKTSEHNKDLVSQEPNLLSEKKSKRKINKYIRAWHCDHKQAMVCYEYRSNDPDVDLKGSFLR